MNDSAIWSNLSEHFNVYGEAPSQGVLANIEHIKEALGNFLFDIPPNSRVLDFGCGTGPLCNRLDSQGYKVVGIDVSDSMIALAREHSPSSITYHVGEAKDAPRLGPFTAAVSLMVFQFVRDIDGLFCDLRAALAANGKLLVSVHSDEYILANPNNHTKFTQVLRNEPLRTAKMALESEEVPIFIRSSEEYREAAERAGFSELWSCRSQPYPDGTPAKYEVMAFARDYG